MLFFVDLSPTRAEGTFSQGRLGRRWGSAMGSLSDDCPRSLAFCRRSCQSNAVGPGSPPGSAERRGTSLITRAQPHIRREDGDSPSLGLLCFHSLQVPHPQPWALHPSVFHGQVPFACFTHSPAYVRLMNKQNSTQTVPVVRASGSLCAPSVPLTHLQVMLWTILEGQVLSSTSPLVCGRFSGRIYSMGLLLFRNCSL